MDARQPLLLAHSLADDARRRAAADRRSATAASARTRPAPRRTAIVRPWLGRLIQPLTNWPGAAG